MVTIRNVDKMYADKQVLFSFSTKIETDKKKIYGLIGPNGAGKTTFLKVLTGILDYSSGDITVDGNADYKEWCRNNIILIPSGERGLRFKNTVHDNVMYYSAMKGLQEQRCRGLLNEYAEIMNFSDFLDRRVETLSMGQKKKAMLLCGLCTDMKVILMDEPSNGLDIDAQLELQKTINILSKGYDKTFLISSHDLGFVSEVVNSYVFIFEGKNVTEFEGKTSMEQIRSLYSSLRDHEDTL